MHQLTLIVLDARNIGPFKVVQNSTRIDEELCLIIDNIPSRQVSYLELPDAFRCVPLGIFDLVLELDVLVYEVVLLIYAFEVFEDLWRV